MGGPGTRLVVDCGWARDDANGRSWLGRDKNCERSWQDMEQGQLQIMIKPEMRLAPDQGQACNEADSRLWMDLEQG